jgi:4-carboxymuconolactone decarboxylase
MDTAERKERGKKLFEKMLGAEQSEQVLKTWQELCPDFENYVVEFLLGEVWSRPQMDLRTRSLTTIAALVALGRWRALELNLRIAVNNGATRQDIVETMLQIAPYAGFPAAWEGLTIAQQVFQGQK